MGAFETIIVLALVGFLMIAAEVFVPGLVLGIVGGLCLIASVVVSYVHYGFATGTLTFAGVFILTLVGFIAWMFAFPHTPMGRNVLLRKNLVAGTGGAPSAVSTLLGSEGEALTPLRPAGRALIAGRKLDVVAESEFIPEGSAVVVVAGDGMRTIVRLAQRA